MGNNVFPEELMVRRRELSCPEGSHQSNSNQIWKVINPVNKSAAGVRNGEAQRGSDCFCSNSSSFSSDMKTVSSSLATETSLVLGLHESSDECISLAHHLFISLFLPSSLSTHFHFNFTSNCLKLEYSKLSLTQSKYSLNLDIQRENRSVGST